MIEHQKSLPTFMLDTNAIINNDNVLGELNVDSRRYSMEYYIYRQYMSIAAPGIFLSGENVYFNEEDDEEIYDFAKKLDKAGALEGLTNVNVTRVESPLVYVDDFYSDDIKERLANQAKCLGAEKIDDVVVDLEIDGEPYLMFLELAKYDDKWYVISQNGTATYIAGLSVYNSGLISKKEFGLLGASDGSDDGSGDGE
jgi:hypothetical protein